jgi:porin
MKFLLASIFGYVLLESLIHPRAALADTPEPGLELASIDDDIRFTPTTRPVTPPAQHPPESDEKNVDTGRSFSDWQRLTDDWFGLRPKLDDRGITFQASLTVDGSMILAGGARNGHSAMRNLFNANLTVDTQRLLGWQGGTLFANFQNQSGKNLQGDVGALQSVSNIDADGRTELSELWFEQDFFDGKAKLKLGKIDANTDFDHTANSDEFINGAFGAQPVVLGFPTYPDPASGASLFVNPTEHTYAGAGVFDGSTQAGRPTGNLGPAGLFHGGSHLFYIGEAGFNWSTARKLDGRFSVGIWHHTADFARFDGSVDHSATGEYVLLDQLLYRENPDKDGDSQGIGFFAKYGYADPNISAIEHQIAAGFAWTGLIPNRDDDVLGAGISWAVLSNRAGLNRDNEIAYELFYRLRLTAWCSVKPDIQYIHGSAAGGSPDTVVGTIRAVIDF